MTLLLGDTQHFYAGLPWRIRDPGLSDLQSGVVSTYR
ncbi:hypothetical protein RSAG8_09038, partial [Rhizoctonia solani AG-8 WAC10335]